MNPAHLRLVTKAKNSAMSRYAPKVACPKGHSYEVPGARTKQGGCRECHRLAVREWMDRPGNREAQNAMRNERRQRTGR